MPPRGVVRRDDRRLLANVVSAMRCRQCHGKPGAALLTNIREPSDIRAFQNKETRKGHTQLVLWDDAARR